MKKFKVGSLFAGVGGICLGFQNAKLDDKGYELVFANEIDEYACETYRNNFKHTLLEGDIHKFLDPSLCSSEDENYYTKEKYPHYFLENGINLAKEVNEKYQFYQCRRGMYVRKNQSNVCPTLTANMGTGGHNVPLIKVADGVRKLTPAG